MNENVFIPRKVFYGLLLGAQGLHPEGYVRIKDFNSLEEHEKDFVEEALNWIVKNIPHQIPRNMLDFTDGINEEMTWFCPICEKDAKEGKKVKHYNWKNINGTKSGSEEEEE